MTCHVDMENIQPIIVLIEMNWIVLIVIILIVVTIIAEVTVPGDKQIVIKTKRDKEHLHILVYPDGSKLILYTAKAKVPLEELRRTFEEQILEGNSKLSVPFKHATCSKNHKHRVYYSAMHGVISYALDVFDWMKESKEELKDSLGAIGKIALSGYIHYNYWYVMSIFRYARTEGRTVAIVSSNAPLTSMAKSTKIIDYINHVRLNKAKIKTPLKESGWDESSSPTISRYEG